MKFVCDTHSLLWYLEDNPRLSPSSKRLFDEPPHHVVIPVIAVAEIFYILRRLPGKMPIEKILKALETEGRFEINPLVLPIIRKAVSLDGLDMHDALIAATALHLDVPLMTCDLKIIHSGHVQILKP